MTSGTPLGDILIEEGRTQSWLAIQVAARIGRPVYRQEVSRWAAGQYMPVEATREAIADALGRPVADLWPSVAHDADVPSLTSGSDTARRKAA